MDLSQVLHDLLTNKGDFMKTGSFTKIHNDFFGSIDGAYTTMTKAEVIRGTYNVKILIKDIVIKHMGEMNLPKFDSSNSLVNFKGCDKLPLLKGKSLNIVFKFSKPPPKKEMSIYFSAQGGVPTEMLDAGNVWYIYFKENDFIPWVGIMKPSEWANISGVDYFDDDIELENKSRKLSYVFNICSLRITEVEPPIESTKAVKQARKRKTVPCKVVQTQLENKKIKGTKGEEIVMEIERRKLMEAGRKDLAERIDWVSSKIDGLGYDIKSFDISSSSEEIDIFIEVKTTSEGMYTPFHISLNEVITSRRLKSSYYIYRVFSLDESGSNVKYYKVNGSIEENFELQPVAFKAFKTNKKP
jgi:hypothetical protein